MNDPFIPLHYMVYALKFDISNTPWKGKRKEISVQEGPLGQLIINGKVIMKRMNGITHQISTKYRNIRYQL